MTWKVIRVSRDVWDALMRLKLNWGVKSVNEVLEKLIGMTIYGE